MGLTSILLAVSGFLLREWKSLYEIFAKLFSFAMRERNIGTYENQEYVVKVELLDTKGRLANYYKRQDLRFLQDNVKVFEDFMYGKGDFSSHYNCSPGKKVDIVQDGHRHKIIIYFKHPKNKGDEDSIHIQTIIRNGFTESEEWIEMEIRRRTRHVELEVEFPPERHCLRAVIQERRHNRTTQLGRQHFTVLPNRCQVVRWERKEKTEPLEVITFKWEW